MIRVCTGPQPAFQNGELQLNGSNEVSRIQSLLVRLGFVRDITGARLNALEVIVQRDMKQAAADDVKPEKDMFGEDGRAQKNPFPLTVLFIDDVRKGRPVCVGQIEAQHALLVGVRRVAGKQVLTYRCSHWQYRNMSSTQPEPNDPNLVPVQVPGFVHGD